MKRKEAGNRTYFMFKSSMAIMQKSQTSSAELWWLALTHAMHHKGKLVTSSPITWFLLQQILCGEELPEAWMCVWMKGQRGLWLCTQKRRRTLLVFTSTLWLDAQHLLGSDSREQMPMKVIRLSTLMPIFALWMPLQGQTFTSFWQCGQDWVQRDTDLSGFPTAHQIPFLILKSSQLKLSPFRPSSLQTNDTPAGPLVRNAGFVLHVAQTWRVITGTHSWTMKAIGSGCRQFMALVKQVVSNWKSHCQRENFLVMLFVRIWFNALETASPRFKLLKQQFCKCHSLGELAVEISSLFKTHSAQLSRIHISISPKHCPRKKRNVTVLNSSSREDLRNSSCWPSAGLKKKKKQQPQNKTCVPLSLVTVFVFCSLILGTWEAEGS